MCAPLCTPLAASVTLRRGAPEFLPARGTHNILKVVSIQKGKELIIFRNAPH